MIAADAALLVAAAATPSGSPSSAPGTPGLPRGLEPTDVTPGLAGFLATAFVVLLSIFLILNLVSRMRRIRHRAALEEAQAAAQAQVDTEVGAGTAGPSVLPGGGPVVQGEVREPGGTGGPGGDVRSRPDETGAPDRPAS